MALLPAELYVEEGYIESGYVGGIADATIGITPYVEEGYIEDGYVEGGGAQFTFAAELTLAIQYGEAALSATASMTIVTGTLHNADAAVSVVAGQTASAGAIRSASGVFAGTFTPVMTAVATKSGDILAQSAFSLSAAGEVTISAESLLEYFADLNAQAARSRDNDAQMAAAFTAGHFDNDLNFNADILPAVDFSAAADLTSAFGFSAEGLNVQFGEATLSTETAATASPIEYISRYTNSIRPLTFEYINGGTTAVEGTHYSYGTANPTAKFGSYSIQLYPGTDAQTTVAIPDLTNENFVIETWVNIFEFSNYTASYRTFLSAGNLSLRWQEDIDSGTSGNQGQISLTYNANGSSQNLFSGSLGYISNTWIHVAVTKNSSTINLVVNGTTVASASSTGFQHGSSYKLKLENNLVNSDKAVFDGLSFQIGSDSIVGYAQYPYETEYTAGIWGFESSASGGTGGAITLYGAGSLSSAASISATLNGIQNTTLVFDSIATQLTAAAKIGDFFVDADSQFSFAADAILIKDTGAAIESAASVTAAAVVTRTGAGSASGVFALTADNSRTRTDSAAIESAFTTSIAGVNTTDVNADFSSAFTANIDNSRTRTDSAAIESAFTTEATGYNIVDADAAISSVAELTALGERIRFADTVFDSIATQLAVAAKIGDFFVNADSQFTAVADAVVKTGSVASLLSDTALVAESERIRPGSSAITSEFAWTSIEEASKTTDASVSSAFTASVAAVITASAVSEMSVTGSVAAEPDKLRRFGSDMLAEFATAAVAVKTTDADSRLDSISAVTATSNKTVDASADLLGFAAIVSVNRILHPEQYLHMVVSENRTYRIPAETRTHTVVSENRIYSIQGI